MIRVGNLEKSIQFYTEVLGFRLLSVDKYPEGKFTLAFLQADGDSGPMIELTYNWDVLSYELGKGYGHMAYQVDSVEAIGNKLKQHGLSFSWGPGKTPSGNRAMAFLQDPDGYSIELLETAGDSRLS